MVSDWMNYLGPGDGAPTGWWQRRWAILCPEAAARTFSVPRRCRSCWPKNSPPPLRQYQIIKTESFKDYSIYSFSEKKVHLN